MTNDSNERPAGYQAHLVQAAKAAGLEVTDCRHCDHVIARPSATSPWLHITSQGVVRRGCRAASFDRLGDWDDTLDRRSMASPPKDYQPEEPKLSEPRLLDGTRRIVSMQRRYQEFVERKPGLAQQSAYYRSAIESWKEYMEKDSPHRQRSDADRIIDLVAGRHAGHAGPLPPALLPKPDDYVGWFENEYGEEMVFVQRKGESVATLLHSDVGWEPAIVVDGAAPEVVLNEPEELWVRACWEVSKYLRDAMLIEQTGS